MNQELQLQDLPEEVQLQILECAVSAGLRLDDIMGWINTAIKIHHTEQEEPPHGD